MSGGVPPGIPSQPMPDSGRVLHGAEEAGRELPCKEGNATEVVRGAGRNEFADGKE